MDEFNSNADVLRSWEEHSDQAWIQAFEDHPVVKAASPEERSRIVPLGIYMDASCFRANGNDSVLAITVRFLNSRCRHLSVALRKVDFCNCGCSGWCSLFPMYTMLAWSFKSLLDGYWPRKRHDDKAWPTDDWRSEMSTKPFGFRGVLVDSNGDWAEFCQRWGLPSWSSASNPCFFLQVHATTDTTILR